MKPIKEIAVTGCYDEDGCLAEVDEEENNWCILKWFLFGSDNQRHEITVAHEKGEKFDKDCPLHKHSILVMLKGEDKP